MAKNWSVSEALKIITTGENLGAIRDIGRRFPLFLFFVSHNPLKIIEAFGERVTARTVNKQLELGMPDIDKVVDEVEEILAERTDYIEKDAKIGKSREEKKEKIKEEKIEKKEREEEASDISSEIEMKKMQKGEMPKDRLITDKEVIELHKREEATKLTKYMEEEIKEEKKDEIKKEDEKSKIKKEDKIVEKNEKREVKKQEKTEDKEIGKDDLDFDVEDLLEE